MKKCFLLLPTTYNDGREVPPAVIAEILEELYGNFGGYSIGGIARGTWRMSDGTKATDSSLQVWVIIGEEQISLMRDLVKKFASLLGQEKILFESMDWAGEFIGPE